LAVDQNTHSNSSTGRCPEPAGYFARGSKYYAKVRLAISVSRHWNHANPGLSSQWHHFSNLRVYSDAHKERGWGS
jgi:hypothetical protein